MGHGQTKKKKDEGGMDEGKKGEREGREMPKKKGRGEGDEGEEQEKNTAKKKERQRRTATKEGNGKHGGKGRNEGREENGGRKGHGRKGKTCPMPKMADVSTQKRSSKLSKSAFTNPTSSKHVVHMHVIEQSSTTPQLS